MQRGSFSKMNTWERHIFSLWNVFSNLNRTVCKITEHSQSFTHMFSKSPDKLLSGLFQTHSRKELSPSNPVLWSCNRCWHKHFIFFRVRCQRLSRYSDHNIIDVQVTYWSCFPMVLSYMIQPWSFHFRDYNSLLMKGIPNAQSASSRNFSHSIDTAFQVKRAIPHFQHTVWNTASKRNYSFKMQAHQVEARPLRCYKRLEPIANPLHFSFLDKTDLCQGRQPSTHKIRSPK